MRADAPLGRLVGLAMICAGLGTATLTTPEAARAATPDRPTAIGVAPNGTAYVGFSTGGRLVRVGADGKLKGGIRLDRDEAVDGLFVTNDGDVWVDYETGFSLLGPAGRVRAHYDHAPLRGCDAGTPASRYGGITAHGHRIYIANRCHDSMSVYARNGDLVATVKLPGRPRGIAYAGPRAGRPAYVHVALPDRGTVLSYRAATLGNSSKPAQTHTLRRPPGGSRPAPGGVAVDRYGQLTVSDMANNALYLLDTTNDFSLYRTLGHPPHASRAAGRLDNPTAIAQHDQDGGGLSGNLFIADANNHRVQRWDTGGYTYWSKGVHAGGDGGGQGDTAPTNTGPTNTAHPSLDGSGVVGTALRCDKGAWTGTDITYRYSWRRNGVPIRDTGSDRYVVLSEDQGTSIACTVTARNPAGSRVVSTSSRVVPTSAAGSPAPTAAPTISGRATAGRTLTCSAGTWSGDPTITFVTIWQRDGATVATGTSYAVTSADRAATLRCLVVAANARGRGAARSAPVGGGACDGATGVVINGGDAETSTPEVLLSVRAPLGTTTLLISNSADLSDATSVPVSGTCTYPWRLDSIPGLPLTSSVYVQFDGAGRPVTDSIRVNQRARRFRLR